MSGAVEAVTSFDVGSLLNEFPLDLGSIVTDFGKEFMTSLDITSFQIPSFDVASLGGFGEIGSLAGSASWFDTFNPGAILSSIPSISDFNISSLVSSVPSLSSIKDITSTVTGGLGSITGTVQSISTAVNKLSPIVNVASNALGIQNPLTPITRAVQQVSGVAGAASGIVNSATGALTGLTNLNTNNLVAAGASALGINPSTVSAIANLNTNNLVASGAAALGINPSTVSAIANLNTNNLVSSGAAALGINPSTASSLTAKATSLFTTNPTSTTAIDVATGLPINTPREVDAYGLGILTDQESTQLTKKATLINSLVDAELPGIKTYNQAIASQTDLETNLAEIKNSIAGNNKTITDTEKNIEELQANLQDPDLTRTQQELLETQLDANYAILAEATANNAQNQESLNSISGLVASNQQIITQTNASVTNRPQDVASSQASQFTSAYDPETGQWSVFDNITGTTVQSGLTEQQAILAEQDLNITNGIGLNTSTTTSDDPYEAARQDAADRLDAAQPSDAEVIAGINSQTAALTTQARAQQSIRELRNNKAQASDWRVRLRLAPNSNYLYKAAANQVGILAPLALTDGVIFPYTPSIDTAYKANYDAYDLTHSNYRGYFYKGSYVDAVNVRAQFTAQDTKEADYLLAVIHFFRSCTKMFYGQDVQRGSPPPLVYLNGYGDYQFSEHPCVVSQFNYTLPPDVDYIRAQSTLQSNTNQLNSRLRNPIANNPLAYSVNRLLNSGLLSGALDFRPTTPGSGNLATGTPTYVPTKMEISITLLPMQSRAQISNNFSVKEFANGNLLKGGYW